MFFPELLVLYIVCIEGLVMSDISNFQMRTFLKVTAPVMGNCAVCSVS
jgi:hypothetical protein